MCQLALSCLLNILNGFSLTGEIELTLREWADAPREYNTARICDYKFEIQRITGILNNLNSPLDENIRVCKRIPNLATVPHDAAISAFETGTPRLCRFGTGC